jgi:pyruvate kinase
MKHARALLAKIVATIGPASESPEMVYRLIEAGVGVFRFNFSHGSEAEHARRLATVREVSRELDRPVAILGDLPGPKIRVGAVAGSGITLSAGQDVVIDPGAASSDGPVPVLGCTLEGIGRDVKPGHKVLINDGAIRLLAVGKRAGAGAEPALECRVIVGGVVTSGKGINLPGSSLGVRAMSDRDWAWTDWAVNHGVDFLALSFVRSAEEVRTLKSHLAGVCALRKDANDSGEPSAIPVIAKIEKPEALAEMEAICEAADGIMVARGDLGVETDLAQVPVWQKKLIACADSWGKPCIVATQMLESMIESASPTRAEVSDVANAVLDGADAVMLSAETAVGKHPTLAVEMMRRVAMAAEALLEERAGVPSPPRRVVETQHRTMALAHGAWHAAHDYGAKAVAVWSEHGGAARYLSQTGLRLPILAYSSSAMQIRRMALLRGVTAVRMDRPAGDSLAAWNRRVDEDLLTKEWAAEGDAVVLLAGRPLAMRGSVNMLALHRVGDRASGFMAHGG